MGFLSRFPTIRIKATFITGAHNNTDKQKITPSGLWQEKYSGISLPVINKLKGLRKKKKKKRLK